MATKVKVTALKLADAPSLNHLFVSALPNDNVYVAGGVQLDLSPGKILDPKALGVVGPSGTPAVTPGVFAQSLAGYYAQVVPATGTGAPGLSTYKLMYFAPGGAEINAGAYPAQITAGQLELLIVY